MLRRRVSGILADYEDQHDHDVLRSDPIFKWIAGTSPDGPDLASQPTLSRFENSVTPRDDLRLREVFVDQFLDSFREPPPRLTFDIDTSDDPAHGKQQLEFFHGYYDQYQYQPRLITCAENDLTVMFCLLFGSAPAALGAEDDVEYLTRRVRQRFPDVEIHFRADSAFGVPLMFDACERSRVTYSMGEKMNQVLQRNSDEVLALATSQFATTSSPRPGSRNGCSRASMIRPVRGTRHGSPSSRPKPTRRGPTAARSSRTAPVRGCFPRRPTTNTPDHRNGGAPARARTVIKRSSSISTEDD